MKYFVFASLIMLTIAASSQDGADSIRIIDLKNQLTNSSGTKKVDLLNEIAWDYGWAALKDKSPASVYAAQALDLAKQLNYQRGIGYALITLSWTKLNENCDSLINAAIAIGERENDYKLLAKSYHRRWEMKTAFDYYKKAGDLQGEAEAATWLCNEYAGRGQYDDGFNYCQRAVELAGVRKTSTPTYSSFISSLAFVTMSKLFSRVGDYTTAFQYLKEAEKYSASDVTVAFAELYMEMGKHDSSVYYYERALQQNPKNGKLSRQVGTANFLAKNYDRAIELLEKDVRGVNDPNFKMQLPVNWKGSEQLELALSYDALKKSQIAKRNYLAALNYQRPEYQKILKEINPLKTEFQKAMQLMDISYGLSKSFYGVKKIDSAYYYLEKYIQYKDQVHNINTVSRLNMQLSNYKKAFEDEKKTGLLNLLNKENQLKASKLQQQILVRNGLLIGLFLLLIAGFFLTRSLYFRRKNEKLRRLQLEKDLKIQQLQAVEMEMQALRAQINPHFIFNCLSSINRFILKNEAKTASGYLTRFSRLMRMVLQNSQKKSITLEDELQMLRLYLEMERLRFKNAFDYSINFLNEVDSDNIFIPPLILQPFCENAIWHGLMHKEAEGLLSIELKIENGILTCTITDNGVGREKAEAFKSKTAEKEKSMGLKITTDRLALLNEGKDIPSAFEIEDLKDASGYAAGTKVIVRIHVYEIAKQLV
jgi:tetratricopeptide (TPR) repeat protein